MIKYLTIGSPKYLRGSNKDYQKKCWLKITTHRNWLFESLPLTGISFGLTHFSTKIKATDVGMEEINHKWEWSKWIQKSNTLDNLMEQRIYKISWMSSKFL